jgi:hypothetical protein
VAVAVLAAAATALAGRPPGAARAAAEAAREPVVGVSGATSPVRLPRTRMAPATLRLGFTSAAAQQPQTPELTGIRFALARRLELRAGGLPSCPLGDLYSTFADPSQLCAGSLLGRGTITSEITLPERAPVTVEGQMTAFYDLGEGQPRILVRVLGGSAMPLSYVIPFTIYHERGAFPTVLAVSAMRSIAGICAIGHPNCFSQAYTYSGIYGHISRFELTLARRFSHGGRKLSVVNADCPAPGRSPSAVLPILRAELAYAAGGRAPTPTATARCEVSMRPPPPRR